jgi:hypothetical protein
MRQAGLAVLEEELDRRDRDRDRAENDVDNCINVDAATGSCDGSDGAVHRYEKYRRLMSYWGQC